MTTLARPQMPAAGAVRRVPRSFVAMLVALCAAGVAATWVANPDLVVDTSSVVRPYWQATVAIGVAAVAALVVASVVHYVAAAAAARAASGARMPFGELTLAQFAASAANRITPAGLGGSALVARYLNRRAGLSVPQASAAVAALTVFGGISDALGLLAIVGIAAAFGSSGTGLSVALHKIAAVVPQPSGMMLAVGGALVAVAVALGTMMRHRIRARLGAMRRGAGAFLATLGGLLRHPGRTITLLTASAGTTVVLAAGFAAAATVRTGGLPLASFGALMIGFMVASAAGSAVPVPGGVGAVDAAQVALLVGLGATLPTAIATVLVFRVITFWLPAVVGLVAARVLRRRGAL